ncbi:hypothetical protein AB0C68_19415 [Streptomyces tendae]|uniref:hypothetical protein n=1 Tax=Streptomyces tendae TaxID=1932 RepID=UPI0033DF2073
MTALQHAADNAATTSALSAGPRRPPRGADLTVQRAESDNAGGGASVGAAEAKDTEGEVKNDPEGIRAVVSSALGRQAKEGLRTGNP